ncbi:MAG TPA: hypothetical protein VMY35_11310 [Phycisphaerae bacterium]|nr:hypothetical protein [Phycisphaerae bacterium]
MNGERRKAVQAGQRPGDGRFAPLEPELFYKTLAARQKGDE